MTLEELQTRAGEGLVLKLNLLSHEGAMYFVEVVSEDRRDILKRRVTDNRAWLFRSLAEVRRALSEVPLATIDLIHQNVCDEIGPALEIIGLEADAMCMTVPLRP